MANEITATLQVRTDLRKRQLVLNKVVWPEVFWKDVLWKRPRIRSGSHPHPSFRDNLNGVVLLSFLSFTEHTSVWCCTTYFNCKFSTYTNVVNRSYTGHCQLLMRGETHNRVSGLAWALRMVLSLGSLERQTLTTSTSAVIGGDRCHLLPEFFVFILKPHRPISAKTSRFTPARW